MSITLITLSSLLILLSILPFVQNQHWVFRIPEFMKLQLLSLQIVIVFCSVFYITKTTLLLYLTVVQTGLLIYHCYLLLRYTRFWKTAKPEHALGTSDKVKILSCNVYQFNTEFHRFIKLIQTEKPDLFLTMESNKEWEHELQVLEKDYPEYQKVPLENTYGMHFYTKLKVIRLITHYFVSDDLPSIEAELETHDGHRFVFFGVHPPPPSPTEEDTSKERDGDLLSVAKKVRSLRLPVIVTGDFNNVAWAKSSILFKKTSRLLDARIGRGVLATFPTKYRLFRIPLDLLFHSPDIFIDRLFIYPSVGSDHFPIGCTFHIGIRSEKQQNEVEDLKHGEMQEVNRLIREGQLEESDNREEFCSVEGIME